MDSPREHTPPPSPPPPPSGGAGSTGPGGVIRWETPRSTLPREYMEVLLVIAAVTAVAWFVPVDYRVFGDLYLLAVIVLCLRVSRWPILFASVVSVLAWNFFIVAPRMAFSSLSLQDGMFLGTYFVVALVAGQLTSRFRAKEQQERQREQHATAMFHLTRALSSARTLDEAVEVALRQADALFGAPTALSLLGGDNRLALHPASSLRLDDREIALAQSACREAGDDGAGEDVRRELSRASRQGGGCLHLPVRRGQTVLGVFSVQWVRGESGVPLRYRKLMEAFAGQIGLLVEREQFRAAGEREKLLAESERMHRTLLDSVSHELKTPVAVLRSAAEGLAREKGARREILAQEIRTAARRLDHLVANLLDQTRLDAGRINLRLDWCDVYDLIGAARRAVGEGLASRPFTINVPPDMPLFMADAVLMEHVLSNLLLNAVHHTPPGTAITMYAGVEKQNDNDDGARVFITVADRGPGIAPEAREKLFQKFERADHARAGGLGLGLSIVRGFMLAQGGDVVADDHPGGGARFTIYLPHKVHESVPHE
ncbi:ATP-binding protein [Geminisphaera colitermitum]|uniref:ATP-binding protein n=1 Tax=Geminisphaera colitermitum TaxID=1148786 RepID=UPI000158D37F|nr:ATP-binding protein [Geminisphaera colitermitum]